MRIERVRVRRVAEGEDAERWRPALEQPGWVADAKVLKEEGGAWVRRATLLGRDVVVKCRPLHTWARRIKSALRRGHADKQWRGAEVLKHAGIRTGAPLAMALANVDGKFVELLALEYVQGKSLLHVLNEISRGEGPSVREQHAIARRVAGTTRQLLRAKAWNSDHKPSNLIVTIRGAIEIDIAVIDCVGVFRCESGIEPQELAADLLIESIGCGCLPRRSLWMIGLGELLLDADLTAGRTLRHRAMKRAIREVRSEIEMHGDPRPRVNPLAHP